MGRSPGERKGNPLQYSGLENSVQSVASQSWTQLREFHFLSFSLLVSQSCPTLFDRMDYTLHGILWARILEWVAFPFSKGSSQPRSPALQAESLLAEPPEKSKNTGVGSLSLIQESFQTQESNQGLLHCRQILYQLSYQGSSFQRSLIMTVLGK